MKPNRSRALIGSRMDRISSADEQDLTMEMAILLAGPRSLDRERTWRKEK